VSSASSANDEIEHALRRFADEGDPATRLAFADAEDERIQSAVHFLAREQLLRPVVIAPPVGSSWPSEVQTVSLDDATWRPRVRDAYVTRRGDEGADDAMNDPLFFMALSVGAGLVESGVAGSTSTSASVVRAGLRGLGVADDTDLACGSFVLGVGEDLWTWADCSVVPDPSAEQLASIAIEAAQLHRRVSGDEPRVAMLSFSTAGSAQHADPTKVREALSFVRARRPDLSVDGEMQFDAAVDHEVGARKFPGSVVAGRANVFVFPDLNTGNVAYKVAQRVGRARIMGSFVLGLRRPWIDLSRGCGVGEIVATALALRAVTSSYATPVTP